MLAYRHVICLQLFCQEPCYRAPRHSHTVASDVSGSKWSCMVVQQHLDIFVTIFATKHCVAYHSILSDSETHCKLAQSVCYISHSTPNVNHEFNRGASHWYLWRYLKYKWTHSWTSTPCDWMTKDETFKTITSFGLSIYHIQYLVLRMN